MNVDAIVDDVADAGGQNLRPLVSAIDDPRENGLSPSHFREFIAGLKASVSQAGRDAFVATVTGLDESRSVIEHGGKRYRSKMPSRKDWLAAFGPVSIDAATTEPTTAERA